MRPGRFIVSVREDLSEEEEGREAGEGASLREGRGRDAWARRQVNRGLSAMLVIFAASENSGRLRR